MSEIDVAVIYTQDRLAFEFIYNHFQKEGNHIRWCYEREEDNLVVYNYEGITLKKLQFFSILHPRTEVIVKLYSHTKDKDKRFKYLIQNGVIELLEIEKDMLSKISDSHGTAATWPVKSK